MDDVFKGFLIHSASSVFAIMTGTLIFPTAIKGDKNSQWASNNKGAGTMGGFAYIHFLKPNLFITTDLSELTRAIYTDNYVGYYVNKCVCV